MRPTHRSGSGLVGINRVRHSSVIVRQVHGTNADPRSGWEASLPVGLQINTVHGQVQAAVAEQETDTGMVLMG